MCCVVDVHCAVLCAIGKLARRQSTQRGHSSNIFACVFFFVHVHWSRSKRKDANDKWGELSRPPIPILLTYDRQVAPRPELRANQRGAIVSYYYETKLCKLADRSRWCWCLFLLLFGRFVVAERCCVGLSFLVGLLIGCGQYAGVGIAAGWCCVSFAGLFLLFKALFFFELLVLTFDQCDEGVTATLQLQGGSRL